MPRLHSMFIALFCYAAALAVIVLFSGCCRAADRVNVHDLEVVNGQSVEAWIEDLETHPPHRDPLRRYGFKERAPWTGWNKFWLASALGGQAADAATTIDGLGGSRCREVNPLFGDDPNEGVIIGSKLAMTLLAIWMAEHLYSGRPDQHAARNWIYGALTVAGAGAAVWNSQQDCQ